MACSGTLFRSCCGTKESVPKTRKQWTDIWGSPELEQYQITAFREEMGGRESPVI